MLRKLIYLLTSICFLPVAVLAASPINRVIYITLDGVRWQDVYLTHDYFPVLWSRYANHVVFYGSPDHLDRSIEVASIPVSLPSYQSQLSGSIEPCDGNECGRIPVETFLEQLVKVVHLNKRDVATFSSWDKIGFAAEKSEGATFANTGNISVFDPDTNRADQVMLDLNKKQQIDHPEEGVRYDKYTFAQAMHYLTTYKPRFMWISLNDADEMAHANRLDQYHQTLAFYDQSLDALFSTLKSLHVDKQTMVIVTTDHGRGSGLDWTHHGVDYPESKQTWAFVMNGELKSVPGQDGMRHFSTLSIRPTIEAVYKN